MPVMKADIQTIEAKTAGSVDLADHIFGLEPRADVSAVRALPEVERCAAADGGYEVTLREGTDAARAMGNVVAAMPVARIELKRPSLEDVFVSLTGEGFDVSG